MFSSGVAGACMVGLLAGVAMAAAAPAAVAQAPPPESRSTRSRCTRTASFANGTADDARIERLITRKTGGNVAVFLYRNAARDAPCTRSRCTSIFPLAHVDTRHHEGPRREADPRLPGPSGASNGVGVRGLFRARAVRSQPEQACKVTPHHEDLPQPREGLLLAHLRARPSRAQPEPGRAQGAQRAAAEAVRPGPQAHDSAGGGKGGGGASRSTSGARVGSTSPRSSCATWPTPAAAGSATPSAGRRPTGPPTRP